MSCHQSWWRLVRPTESQTQTPRVWNLKKSEKEIRKKSSATTISLCANNLKKSEEKIGKRNALNNLKKIPVRPVRRLHSEGRNWSWDSKVFVQSFRWNRLCLVAGITSGKTTKVHPDETTQTSFKASDAKWSQIMQCCEWWNPHPLICKEDTGSCLNRLCDAKNSKSWKMWKYFKKVFSWWAWVSLGEGGGDQFSAGQMPFLLLLSSSSHIPLLLLLFRQFVKYILQ